MSSGVLWGFTDNVRSLWAKEVFGLVFIVLIIMVCIVNSYWVVYDLGYLFYLYYKKLTMWRPQPAEPVPKKMEDCLFDLPMAILAPSEKFTDEEQSLLRLYNEEPLENDAFEEAMEQELPYLLKVPVMPDGPIIVPPGEEKL